MLSIRLEGNQQIAVEQVPDIAYELYMQMWPLSIPSDISLCVAISGHEA